MEKLVKVIVVGALGENGRVNANAQETIALYVDPFDKELRTFVLKAATQRFAWLEFVPLDQLKLHWIDAEGDRISIYAEADMDICIEHGGSIPKIYIVVGPNEQLRSADTDAGCTATTSAQTDATKPSASGASTATPAASASASAAGALHPNVICDSCNGEVRGVRYKCAQCADFDLCSACESQGKHTHHMMYRMAEPQHDIGSHIERRLSKWLRKHMPRDTAEPGCQRDAPAAGSHHAHHHHPAPPAATLGGGGCRRNGGSLAGRRHHHDWKRHCEPSVGTYTCTRGAGEATASAAASSSAGCSAAGAAGESKTAPQQQPPRFNADHIADALSHARTAEKAAAAGFELLSKFSSILDPFGVNLADVVNAATGYNGGEANSATDGAERPGCQFAAAAKAAAARAAEAATAAQTATAAAEAAAAAATSQAPQASSTAAAGETVVTTEPRPSTSAPSSVPATPQKSTATASAGASPSAAANKEDNVSVRSADSMDSVLEALMEATKDANKGKPEPDVD